jgi:hypothetical protein
MKSKFWRGIVPAPDIDIGANGSHVIGPDARSAIALPRDVVAWQDRNAAHEFAASPFIDHR